MLLMPCASARTAIEFFTEPGASAAFGELEQNTRLDMVDYYTNSLSRTTANVLNGPARILAATDTVLKVQPARQTLVDLYVLTAGVDTVLMAVETLRLPQPDSHIDFYDTKWKPLSRKPLEAPVLSDWLTENGRNARREVELWLPFMLAQASYDPATQTLTLTNTLDQYFPDPADRDKLHKWIRPQLTYVWKNRKFTPLYR